MKTQFVLALAVEVELSEPMQIKLDKAKATLHRHSSQLRIGDAHLTADLIELLENISQFCDRVAACGKETT